MWAELGWTMVGFGPGQVRASFGSHWAGLVFFSPCTSLAKMGRCRTCRVVDILKASQQGAEPVWYGCHLGVLDWVHIGGT